jgi:hypothetical protein
MRLERDDAKLHGLYRYAKSAEDIALEGSVVDKDGTFELIESVRGKVTGRFSGVFSFSALLAVWSSPDGTRSYPVEAMQGDPYPETIDLGGGLAMYPQESLLEDDRCSVDIIFPQVRGSKDRAKERALNELLRGDREAATSCEPGPEDIPDAHYSLSEEYSLLLKKKGRFLSLSQGGWSYASYAAHPNGGARCTVIDTKTLTEFRMVDFLTEDGRGKLGDKVTERIQGGGPSLTEQNYFDDHLSIGEDTNVCLTDTEIRVEFRRYEVAPYVMGDPGATFPKAEVRALFEKGEVMDAVFAP